MMNDTLLASFLLWCAPLPTDTGEGQSQNKERITMPNISICQKCKRLFLPEVGCTCPKCGGTLEELRFEDGADSGPAPDEIRNADLTKRLVTFNERKTS